MRDDAAGLQQQILQYLQRNARAAETAEGVNRMWLRRPHTPENIVEVERTLDALVDAGHLEKHELPGGVAAYRRARYGH